MIFSFSLFLIHFVTGFGASFELKLSWQLPFQTSAADIICIAVISNRKTISGLGSTKKSSGLENKGVTTVCVATVCLECVLQM